MAAECVGGVAGAVFVTDESVQSGGAEAVLTAGALEALIAQTGAVDVVALGSVLTVTFMGALRPVRPHRALILTPLSHVPGVALTLTTDVVTQAAITTRTLLRAVDAERSEWTRLSTDRTHPACRTGAGPGDVMTGSAVLTGTALLAQRAVFTWRTRLLTEGPGVSGRTQALSCLMVAGGAVEALALQEAVLPVEAGVTGLLAAPALVPVRADTGAGYGVTFGPVPALTAVTAVRSPEVALTAAGAVESSPTRLTLTGIRRHTAAVSALFSTQRNTQVPTFVESRAALRATSVHRPHSSPVRCLIADPVSGAFEPVEDVGAAGVVNLVERVSVRLLNSHSIALPVAAHVGVIRVEGRRHRDQTEQVEP